MEKATVKKHFVEIDVYKGIAILLIIFGHSFCTFPVDFRDTNLINVQHLLGTFNLNMFFLASGVLFSVKGTWTDFFKKKLSRLMLPWLAFTIVYLVMKKMMAAFVNHPAGNIGHELLMDLVCGKSFWFLYALFLMMILTKLLRNKYVLITVGGALLFALPLTNYIPASYDFLCAVRVIHYYPWFLMGFFIKDKYGFIAELTRKHVNKSFVIGLILFAIMVTMVITGALQVYIIKYYVMAVLGCVSFYLLSCKACETKYMRSIMTFFGKYSLQYYLNHLLIMLACFYVGAKVFVYSPLASLTLIFLSALLVSTIMLWLEKKTPKPFRSLFGFI